MPAKAGSHISENSWIPAYAGMTEGVHGNDGRDISQGFPDANAPAKGRLYFCGPLLIPELNWLAIRTTVAA
jgi:hypothetical protein